MPSAPFLMLTLIASPVAHGLRLNVSRLVSGIRVVFKRCVACVKARVSRLNAMATPKGYDAFKHNSLIINNISKFIVIKIPTIMIRRASGFYRGGDHGNGTFGDSCA